MRSGCRVLLCEESITLTVHDFSHVTQKGINAMNDYSVKYNELNQLKAILIHAFDNNENRYVHVRCRKAHTNNRHYEQMLKRKYDSVSSSTHKLRYDVKNTDNILTVISVKIWLIQEKIKWHPNNKDFEFSGVVLLQVKGTITKICSERRVSTVDEWADAVSH